MRYICEMASSSSIIATLVMYPLSCTSTSVSLVFKPLAGVCFQHLPHHLDNLRGRVMGLHHISVDMQKAQGGWSLILADVCQYNNPDVAAPMFGAQVRQHL